MSDFLQSLSHLLPNQVTLSAVLPNLSAGGPGVGEDSYFDLNITDPSGILNGSFDAFCIDTDLPLGFNGFDLDNDGVYNETNIPVPTLGGGQFDEGDTPSFSATVYSSYDPTVVNDGLGGLIEKPENLDLVNWIINNTDLALAAYNTAEIQLAIWELMDDTAPSSDDELGLDAFFGGYDRDNVDAIKAMAQANGDGFIPQAGDKVAIILVPDGNDGAVDGVPDGQIIVTAVELAQLGDFVFEDLDADGIQDAGEVGIANATVNLLADVDGDGVIEADEVVDTTTTDANGLYHFNVLPGDYQVQFETPDDFDMASPANQGGDDAIDSDGPLSEVVSLDPGEIDSSIDAGFFKKAGLGDFVFNDADGDGVQDAGESGVEGMLVKLQNPDGSAVVDGNGDPITTTTDTNGAYAFNGLTPGEYKVMFVAPDGFSFTTANAGGDDAVDSDADPANGMTQTVTLTSGEFNGTLDAGLVQLAQLGDFVFEDLDADGIQDANEAGIAGATVNLLQAGQVIATATTDADGKYHFNDLQPGDYQVEFVTPDGLDMASPANVGGNDAIDSDGPLTAVVTLGPGESDLTLDAGFFKKAGLGDFVFNDADGDGVQDAGESGVEGVLVKLQNPDGSAVVDGNGDPITTTTDANGAYAFNGLTPGEYKVMFVAPDGFSFTTANAGGDDAVDSDADPSNGMTQTVTLTSGEFNGTLDAGLVQLAKLGDFVFEDLDADGIQDANESGIAGATVNLLQAGQVIATATTDADGKYHFNDLQPGEYQVEFVTPDGFDMASPANVGGNDAIDSDGPLTAVVTLGPGESDLTLDAGFFKKAGLGDFVFNDADGDGVQDAGESGVEGVLVKLQNPDGSAVVDGNGDPITTTTDANGAYAFNGLTPGEYKVMFVAPDGFSFTTANAGGDDAVDSDADPANGMTQTVMLTSGEFNGTLDAGLIQLAPGIDIEKFVNGIDVTDLNNLPEIAAGADVTFTYEVTNTGNVAFTIDEVVVTDDNGTPSDISDDFTPTLDLSSDVGSDGILSAGETWRYASETLAAQDLTTSTSSEDLTFVFMGSTPLDGPDGNVRSFTAGDVSVDVSAFRRKSSGAWDTAYLGAYSGGLGVTNRGESTSYHRVDNGGSVEYLLFEFDRDVTVDRAFLDYVNYDSDISIWIGDRNGADISALSDGLLNSFVTENNFTHSKYSRWADINASELAGDTVVISAYTGHDNDAFKLKKLDVSVAGESIAGVYQNVATVTAQTVSDSDTSGYVNGQPLASLGDRVWYDTDRDGIQDAGEQGVQGVKVSLTGGGADGVIGTSDDTTATTTTDANGHYKFENLNPGEEYKVTFSHLPNGYEFTTPNVGGDDAVDSDVIPSSPLVKESIFIANAGFEADNLPYNSSHTVGHISGWDVHSPRAGAWNAHPYSYSGEAPEGDVVAYIDQGGTISQTLAETFEAGNSYELSFAVGDERWAGDSSGWEARLYAGGTLLGSVSNADFNPGDDTFVTAKLQLDADALQAYSSAYGEQLKIEFYDNGLAANVHFDDVKLTKERHTSDKTGMTQTVILAPGEHNPTLDAGLVKSVGSLSGTVFHDNDCDGLETSETVIAHEDYTNGADAGWWDPWVMQRHNGDKYLGGFGNTYRTTDDTAKTFNVPAGTEKLKVEFDFLEVDSWDGEHFYAFVDGQRIDLGKFFVDGPYGNRAEGQSGQLGNVAWTVSNGYTTQNFAGTGWSDEVHKVTFHIDNPGTTVRLGFGSNLNENKHNESWGIDNLKLTAINSKSQGKAGVKVTLLDGHGNEVLDANGDAITTTTNADGDYHFNNVVAGDYRVRVDAPNGKSFTDQNVGTDDAIDSDVDANGISDVVTVVAGQDTNNVDAGLKDLKASIGDRVWYDNNRNGIQDAGEGGVEGVTVQLRRPNLQLISSTVTDANGYYTFDNLTPGDYLVDIGELPNGYQLTSPNQGSDDNRDSDADPTTGWMPVTTLTAGEHDRSFDAGIFKEICAKLVGSSNIHEGDQGSYYVELDHVSDVDRYFTLKVDNGSAKRVDRYAGNQDIIWGGYYDVRVASGGGDDDDDDDDRSYRYHRIYNRIPNNLTSPGFDSRPATGPSDASWDYTIYKNGHIDTGNTVTVKVAAGQTQSEAFQVQTWLEQVSVDRHVHRSGYYEGTEKFSVRLVSGDADTFCGDHLHVSIHDRTHYNIISPIALDLNGDGVQTTALGATQGAFDLMANGAPVESGWLSGKDAFLARDLNGNGSIDDRSELFGGNVGDGFAQLATYDANSDGLVDADEILSGGLLLWQDSNENHRTDAGELISLESQGIVSLNTAFVETPVYQHGNLLLEHGVANRADGSQVDMVDAYFQVADTIVNPLSAPASVLG